MLTPPTRLPDSRFFPGYFWVSERPDGKLGLSLSGPTPQEAGLKMLTGGSYYRRPAVVYVWATPESEPVVVR